MQRPATIAVENDKLFEFVFDLPVFETFFDGVLRLHTLPGLEDTDKVPDILAEGKLWRPVVTVIKEEPVREATLFVVPCDDTAFRKPVLGVFSAGATKTSDFAFFANFMIHSFGLTRKRFAFKIFYTPESSAQNGLPTMAFCREFLQRPTPLCAGTLLVAPGSSRYISSLLSTFVTYGFSMCPIIVCKSEGECTRWITSHNLAATASDLACTFDSAFAAVPWMAKQLRLHVSRCKDEATRAKFNPNELAATCRRIWGVSGGAAGGARATRDSDISDTSV